MRFRDRLLSETRESISHSGRCALPEEGLPEPLARLWDDVHRAVEESCRRFGETGDIQSGIEYLRKRYVSEKLDGPPRFDSESVRLAYAVSYHPAHAFAYLHLLMRRGLGQVIFGDLVSPPKVLVLGAGVGAETLASLRWMSAVETRLVAGSRFVLVDRAAWETTRASVLAPTVRELWTQHKFVFDEVTSDLSSQQGLDFLREECGHADVIFCPSVISEMISEHSQNQMMEVIHETINRRAKLVLIDHKDPEFEHVSRQWARRFTVLSDGATPGVIIPQPTAWVRTHLLDGANHRIPTKSYPMAWSVLKAR